MFVFREEYYLERAEAPGGHDRVPGLDGQDAARRGKAEVIIGKQRHGPIGTVQLQFDGNVTRFADLARDQYLPERHE